jgi:hypothetical protein
MISRGLFTHVFLLIMAVTIAVTFIRPTMAEIGSNQDKILLYQEEIAKVSNVNSKLSTLVDTYNTVSLTDKTRLRTYMPDYVDTIAVPRDIYAIALEAGVILDSVSFGGADASDTSAIDATSSIVPPTLYIFSVSLQGSYSQIKRFLELIEQNNYPLEVRSLDITSGVGGYLSAEISLGTYGSAAAAESE